MEFRIRLHLMKLHSINCGFNTFFKLPIKINNTLLMLILIMKNITNNTMNIAQEQRSQELHIFS